MLCGISNNFDNSPQYKLFKFDEIYKYENFFDKYVGISNVADDDFEYEFTGEETSYMSMVAENKVEYQIDE